MLEQPDIDAIAADVARQHVPPGAFLRASSQPYESPYGGDELRVKMEFRDAPFSEVTGRQLNRIIADLQQRLRAKGETRFANIDWATDAPPLPEGED